MTGAGEGSQGELPPLPPEHARPTTEEFVAAGYDSSAYLAQMESWETGIRRRLAAGEKYEDIVPPPDQAEETPSAEALPADAPAKAATPVATRPSFAYPGHHEDGSGRLVGKR